MRNDIKQDFDAFYKHVGIFDIAASMNMQIGDVDMMIVHYFKDLI